MHYSNIIIVISLFFYDCGFAQNQLDSLESLINSKEGTDKINFINQISSQYIDKDIDIAKRLSDEAYHLSETMDNMRGKGDASSTLGLIYYFEGQLNQSEYYCKIAQGISSSLKDTRLEREVNTTLALVFEEEKVFDKSIQLFKRNITIDKRNPDHLDLAIDYQNLARVNEKSGQIKTALNYLVLSKNLFESGGYTDRMIKVYDFLGELYLHTNPDSSLYYLSLSYALYQNHTNMPDFYDIFWDLSEYFMLQNNPDSSRYFLMSAGEKAKKEGVSSSMLTVYQKLTELYEYSGDYRNAFVYQKKYNSLKDSLKSSEFEPDVTDHIQKLENENKDQMVELLRKEAQINERQWLTRDVIFYMIIGGIFLVFFVFIAFYARYKLFRKSIASTEKLKEDILMLTSELSEKKEFISNQNNHEKKLVKKIQFLGSVIGNTEAKIGDIYDETIIGEFKRVASTVNAEVVGLYVYYDFQQFAMLGELDVNKEEFKKGDNISVMDYPVYFQAVKSNEYLSSDNSETDSYLAEINNKRGISPGRVIRIDIPVRIEQKLMGVLYIEKHSTENNWSEHEIETMIESADRFIPILVAAFRNKSNKENIAVTSEIDIHALFNRIQLLLMEKDEHGTITRFMPDHLEIPPVIFENMVGKNWIELLDIGDHDKLVSFYKSLEAGQKEHRSVIYNLPQIEGKKIEVKEEIIGIVGLSTEKRIESVLHLYFADESINELKLQLNSLRAVISSLIHGIVVCNARGKIILVNPAVEKITGHASNDLISNPLNLLFENENVILENSFREPKPLVIFIKTKYGEPISCHISISSFLVRSERYYILEFYSKGNKIPAADSTSASGSEPDMFELNILKWFLSYRISFYHFLLESIHYNLPVEFKEMNLKLADEEFEADDRNIYYDFKGLIESIGADLSSGNYSDEGVFASDIFILQDRHSYALDPRINWLMQKIISGNKDKITYHCEFTYNGELLCNLSVLLFVLFQLVNNSRESMNGVGDIYIKTICVQDKFNLVVTDTGEGISAEVKKKLFSGPVSIRPDHLGYGLYFVKKIIDRINGNIHIRSQLNKGTEVLIEISSIPR